MTGTQGAPLRTPCLNTWVRRTRIELDSKPGLLGVNVGERLSLRGTGKAAMIVMVANRTREIRPSGIARGLQET